MVILIHLSPLYIGFKTDYSSWCNLNPMCRRSLMDCQRLRVLRNGVSVTITSRQVLFGFALCYCARTVSQNKGTCRFRVVGIDAPAYVT